MIGWVVVVCLMQNSGLASSCSINYETISPSMLVGDDAYVVQTDKGKDLSQCELSEKLIQFAQHQLEAFIVVLFVGILVSAIWRGSVVTRARQWTEPIRYKYRVHLTFCVFRE
ncbi:hypothetical protein ATG66_2891 [Vibrio sp. ES.051]|nr:hypothetical protein ATG66_2891 [Vibrio sp. ES.051]